MHRVEPGRRDRSAETLPTGRASRAFGWSFLNTAVGRLGTIGIGIVLARLLGPSAFGTYAVATVALIAILSFNELGVSLAIVRWPGDPEEIAPTVTTISVVSSTVLAVAAFFAAPAFSSAMGDPSATPVVRLMLISILVNGAVATPAALLQRNFQQSRRMVVDQVNVWLGALLSVGLALAGMGAMSLAIGRVAGSLVSGVFFVTLSGHRYRFGWRRDKVPALLTFGLPLAGSSIVVFAIGYADQLAAGAVLGSVALGYYVLAFNLASWPVTLFSQPLRSVAPAAFARQQHDRPAMLGTLGRVIGVLGGVTLPVCLLIAGAAHPIVQFVYGPRWSASAGVLVWLAVLAAFRIFFELAYDFLVVLGRSNAILMIQIVWLATLVPALVIGGRTWGLPGLAAAQVGVAALVTAPIYLTLLRNAGLSFRLVVRRLVLPTLVAVGVGVASYLLSRAGLAAFPACVLAGLVGAGAVAVLLYRDRDAVRSLRAAGEA